MSSPSSSFAPASATSYLSAPTLDPLHNILHQQLLLYAASSKSSPDSSLSWGSRLGITAHKYHRIGRFRYGPLSLLHSLPFFRGISGSFTRAPIRSISHAVSLRVSFAFILLNGRVLVGRHFCTCCFSPVRARVPTYYFRYKFKVFVLR